MTVTFNEKFIAYLTLISGLLISGVAEYYSIVGFTAIFAAAVIPVIIMGIALGVGKISATLWLKQNWEVAPWTVRIYLLVAIFVLMCVTSLGIFGFLSKAHSDQTLVSGDVQSKIAVYDEKIKTAKDNIDANRKALKQMDEAVDQVMGRSTDEKGADKAVAIRRGQSKERARLLAEIQAEQKTITQLSEERAPIAAEVRKVEAEVGPIKYIAAFIYGDNTDANILEKAVTWVIILLIVVFDPLAVILLLASQISFQNFRDRERWNFERDLEEAADAFNDVFEDELRDGYVAHVGEKPTAEELAEIAEGDSPEKESDIVSTATVTESILDQHPYLTKPFAHFKNLKPMVYRPEVETTSTYQIFPELQEELDKSNDSLFVQNEEQTESNLWSKTTAISQDEYQKESLSRQEVTLFEWINKIKTGKATIQDVPPHMIPELKKRM